MSRPIRKPKLTPEQVKALPEFAVLTEKQKAFVLLLADGVPAHLAAFGGYNFTSFEAAQKAVSGFLRSKKIRSLVDLIFPDAKTEFLRELDGLIADPQTTPAQIDGMVVKGVTLGLLPANCSIRKFIKSLIP